MPPMGSEAHNPSKRVAAESCLKLCSQWDRHLQVLV